MSVAITELTLDPETFKKGNAKTTLITYLGVISNEPDRTVRMEFSLEEDNPVFVVDEEGEEVKKIGWEEELTQTEKTYEKEIKFRVKEAQAELTEAEVKLKARTATQKRSSCTSFIFYK